MGIASLVLGIVSLVFVFTGPISFIAVIVGIVGIVLGALARKKLVAEKQPTGAATAGLVMSIIGVVIGAIVWISCVACVSAGTKAFEEGIKADPKLQQQLQDVSKDLEKTLKEVK